MVKHPLLSGAIAFGIQLLSNSAILSPPVVAQNIPIVIEPDGGECELNSLHVNQLRRQAANNGNLIFIIARLGDGELSKDLNRRRLHNVRVIFKSDNLVVAEGERIKGPGCIEIYIDCKLALVSKIKRGRDICLTCCDPEKSLYPWYRPKRASE